MKEILWHGRGGQGAFTAAKLLGAAFSLSDGNYSLAFPAFGPERRGAPILAFTKLDSKTIGDRSQIKRADFVVYLDDTLFSSAAFYEIKEGGKIFVNTRKTTEELISLFSVGSNSTGGLGAPMLRIPSGQQGAGNEALSDASASVITFDADSIALEILKLPVTNTVMLAVLAEETGLVSQKNLEEAIEFYMPSKLQAKNIAIIERIFKRSAF